MGSGRKRGKGGERGKKESEREEKGFLSAEPVKLTYLKLSFNMMFIVKSDFLSSQFHPSLSMLLGVGGQKVKRKKTKPKK